MNKKIKYGSLAVITLAGAGSGAVNLQAADIQGNTQGVSAQSATPLSNLVDYKNAQIAKIDALIAKTKDQGLLGQLNSLKNDVNNAVDENSVNAIISKIQAFNAQVDGMNANEAQKAAEAKKASEAVVAQNAAIANQNAAELATYKTNQKAAIDASSIVATEKTRLKGLVDAASNKADVDAVGAELAAANKAEQARVDQANAAEKARVDAANKAEKARVDALNQAEQARVAQANAASLAAYKVNTIQSIDASSAPQTVKDALKAEVSGASDKASVDAVGAKIAQANKDESDRVSQANAASLATYKNDQKTAIDGSSIVDAEKTRLKGLVDAASNKADVDAVGVELAAANKAEQTRVDQANAAEKAKVDAANKAEQTRVDTANAASLATYKTNQKAAIDASSISGAEKTRLKGLVDAATDKTSVDAVGVELTAANKAEQTRVDQANAGSLATYKTDQKSAIDASSISATEKTRLKGLVDGATNKAGVDSVSQELARVNAAEKARVDQANQNGQTTVDQANTASLATYKINQKAAIDASSIVAAEKTRLKGLVDAATDKASVDAVAVELGLANTAETARVAGLNTVITSNNQAGLAKWHTDTEALLRGLLAKNISATLKAQINTLITDLPAVDASGISAFNTKIDNVVAAINKDATDSAAKLAQEQAAEKAKQQATLASWTDPLANGLYGSTASNLKTDGSGNLSFIDSHGNAHYIVDLKSGTEKFSSGQPDATSPTGAKQLTTAAEIMAEVQRLGLGAYISGVSEVSIKHPVAGQPNIQAWDFEFTPAAVSANIASIIQTVSAEIAKLHGAPKAFFDRTEVPAIHAPGPVSIKVPNVNLPGSPSTIVISAGKLPLSISGGYLLDPNTNLPLVDANGNNIFVDHNFPPLLEDLWNEIQAKLDSYFPSGAGSAPTSDGYEIDIVADLGNFLGTAAFSLNQAGDGYLDENGAAITMDQIKARIEAELLKRADFQALITRWNSIIATFTSPDVNYTRPTDQTTGLPEGAQWVDATVQHSVAEAIDMFQKALLNVQNNPGRGELVSGQNGVLNYNEGNPYESIENFVKNYYNTLTTQPTQTVGAESINFIEKADGTLVANLDQALIDDLKANNFYKNLIDSGELKVGENVLTQDLLTKLVAEKTRITASWTNPFTTSIADVIAQFAAAHYTPDANGVFHYSRTMTVADGNGGSKQQTFTNKKDQYDALKLYKKDGHELQACMNPFSFAATFTSGRGGGGSNLSGFVMPPANCNYVAPTFTSPSDSATVNVQTFTPAAQEVATLSAISSYAPATFVPEVLQAIDVKTVNEIAAQLIATETYTEATKAPDQVAKVDLAKLADVKTITELVAIAMVNGNISFEEAKKEVAKVLVEKFETATPAEIKSLVEKATEKVPADYLAVAYEKLGHDTFKNQIVPPLKEIQEEIKKVQEEKQPTEVIKNIEVPVEKTVEVPVEKTVEVPVEKTVEAPFEERAEAPFQEESTAPEQVIDSTDDELPVRGANHSTSNSTVIATIAAAGVSFLTLLGIRKRK